MHTSFRDVQFFKICDMATDHFIVVRAAKDSFRKDKEEKEGTERALLNSRIRTGRKRGEKNSYVCILANEYVRTTP